MKVWQPMQVKLIGSVKDVVKNAAGFSNNTPN